MMNIKTTNDKINHTINGKRILIINIFIIGIFYCVFSFQLSAYALPFVTVTNIPGKVTSIVSAKGKLYVAREDFPTILVYDARSNTLEAEISLLLASQLQPPPAGALAITATRDSIIIAASIPSGEMFKIENYAATSIGLLSIPSPSETVTLITSMYTHTDGSIYIGGRAQFANSNAYLHRMYESSSPATASWILLPGDSIVHSIKGIGRKIGVAVRDSNTPHNGKFYLCDTVTFQLQQVYNGDSDVTAVGITDDTLIFSVSPSGLIKRLDGTNIAAMPDTYIRYLHYGFDSADTVTFVLPDSNVLRGLKGTTIKNYKTVDPLFSQIFSMATINEPLRHYGVARGAAFSYLFYFDSFAPWVESITFNIETGLRQPGRPDTFLPPLTRGSYIIKVRTNEKLAAAPQIRIFYSDASQQNITMSGSDRDFSGIVVIDSSKPAGNFSIGFIGADDAGNTGTIILQGQIGELLSPGKITIANNLIYPGKNEFVSVRYLLYTKQNVSIKIFNMRGQLVADISPGVKDPGEYEDVKWYGKNTRGEYAASGVYYLHFDAGSEGRLTAKIMVIK